MLANRIADQFSPNTWVVRDQLEQHRRAESDQSTASDNDSENYRTKSLNKGLDCANLRDLDEFYSRSSRSHYAGDLTDRSYRSSL
jgi:hypothetical protein